MVNFENSDSDYSIARFCVQEIEVCNQNNAVRRCTCRARRNYGSVTPWGMGILKRHFRWQYCTSLRAGNRGKHTRWTR